MSIASMNGEWQLKFYHHLVDEIPWGDEEDTACLAEIQAWLRGKSDAQIPDAVPMAGLVMKLQGSAFSEETIEFDALMFDVNGVQVNAYVPMTGTVVDRDGLTILKPAGVPDWATPNSMDASALRYDDGDTKVCDNLRLIDGQLVRQVSVVTDEIYLERMVLVYGRVR